MAYITQSAQHPVIKVIKGLLIVLVLVAVAVVYLYLNPDIWRSWVKGTPLEPEPSVTYLYKWRDENGQWQMTDKAPASGVEYELLEFNSDTNVMPLAPREEN